MSATPRVFIYAFLVLLLLFFEQLSMGAAPRKGLVQGTREANLRAGPGVEHGVKGTVKENEQLTVQGQEGDWYLVETAAGQKGYLYKDFLKVAGEEQAGAIVTEPKTAPGESKEATKAPVPVTDAATAEQSPPPPPAPPAQKITQSPSPSGSPNQPPKSEERKTSSPRAPSLIELLDGREADVILWVCIAIVFFLIGWISGGHYYLRRDRTRRTKLRF
jgi:uncharacterized protein YraI